MSKPTLPALDPRRPPSLVSRLLGKPARIALFLAGTGTCMALLFFRALYGGAAGWRFWLIAPAAFSFVIIDFLALAALTVLLARPARLWRLTVCSLMALLMVMEMVQFLSLYYTNTFLNREVLAHWRLVGLLVNGFTVAAVFLPPAILVTGYLLLARRHGLWRLKRGERAAGTISLVLLVLLLLVLNHNLERVKLVHLAWQAGKESAVSSTVSLLAASGLGRSTVPSPVTLDEADLETAREYGITVNPARELPFAKDWIYRSGLPYPAVAPGTRPNLIVLFVDSLDAGLLGPYGGPFPGLTPHLDDFAGSALTVQRYYNHVTTTILGLRGQLCSIFPRLPHEDRDRATFKLEGSPSLGLPRILDQAGYRTIFFGCSHPNETFFETQMKDLGFRRTYFYEDLLREFLHGEKPSRGRKGVGDVQLMRSLVEFLRYDQAQDGPFFLALSTIETDPGMDVIDRGMIYGDGKSGLLNSYHQFDTAFGIFWEAFKKSRYAGNTIVVVTADHAHAPGVELREVAWPGYSGEHFDAIPLIIYDPTHVLPARLKANTTSLDLAPTMLQLLGIPDRPNPFLGLSIFTDRPATRGGIGLMFRDGMGLVTPEGVLFKTMDPGSARRCGDLPAGRGRDFCSLYRVIEYAHYLDYAGRYWK